MYPIQDSQWGLVRTKTWAELTSHQWECFRLSLMILETKQDVQGVVIEQSKTIFEIDTEMIAQGAVIVYAPSIMQQVSEMVVSIVVSNRNYKLDLIKLLPLYERKSGTFHEIMDAYDLEFRNSEQSIEVLKRNIFLDTAIETLGIHERDLGIKNVDSLKYAQRREQINSRYIASFDQTTEETIKNIAHAYSNGEVEIYTSDTEGIYEIKFVGTKGIPSNLAGLEQAIEVVIPAHLGIKYTFTFNAWDVVRNLTWGSVRDKTWTQLKTWNEVE